VCSNPDYYYARVSDCLMQSGQFFSYVMV
jgi:hypothetical protein